MELNITDSTKFAAAVRKLKLKQSQPLNLRKVAKIGQKYKDIVFGYIHRIQLLFPDDNNYFNIVDLIKFLCLLYYHDSIFESEILTEIEQSDFFELLSQNEKHFQHYEWKLIYKGKRDGLNAAICNNICRHKKNLFCFIHTEGDNVFGGYTSNGWRSGHLVFNTDPESFIFGIRSSKKYKPIISNIKYSVSMNAMVSYDGYYLWFGSCSVIRCADTGCVYHENPTCYNPLPTNRHFTGGKSSEKLRDIEVFQLT